VIPLEITLTVVGVCLLFEAFFSGAEMAVVSASRSLLRRKAGEGEDRGKPPHDAYLRATGAQSSEKCGLR